MTPIVPHDSGHTSHDSDHTFRLRSNNPTLVAPHDSSHISLFWSYVLAPVLHPIIMKPAEITITSLGPCSHNVVLGFMPKPSTHRMHDLGSIVPHIRPKVFTDNQMSRIKHNYYISNVSKDYDNSQRNGTAEDSITPQEWQPGQHII
jgi:hypothetical protein